MLAKGLGGKEQISYDLRLLVLGEGHEDNRGSADLMGCPGKLWRRALEFQGLEQ